MTNPVKLLAVGALALTVAACGASDSDPGPGGVTAGEAEMLDKAAEMLDERQPDFSQQPAEQTEQPTPSPD